MQQYVYVSKFSPRTDTYHACNFAKCEYAYPQKCKEIVQK